MLHRTLPPPTIELPATRFEAPLQLDLERFLAFSFWMTEELLDLEERHADPRRRRPHKVKH